MNITRHLTPSKKHHRTIQHVCSELFKLTRFSYFGINRFYPKEGRWMGIYSEPGFVENALGKGMHPPLVGPKGLILPTGIYPNSEIEKTLNTQINPEVFHKYYLKKDCKDHNNITESGVNFVFHTSFYQELFYFSCDLDQQETRAYYKKLLPVMKSFCAFSSYQLRDVLSYSENYKEHFHIATLEPENQFVSDAKIEYLMKQFNKTKYKVPTRLGDVFISRQEKAVLQLLAKGFNGREIADKLEISYRTYETYLSSLKTKLACEERHEIIQSAEYIL